MRKILYLIWHGFHILQAYIENLAREAYANWNSLEVLEGIGNETALLTQGVCIYTEVNSL